MRHRRIAFRASFFVKIIYGHGMSIWNNIILTSLDPSHRSLLFFKVSIASTNSLLTCQRQVSHFYIFMRPSVMCRFNNRKVRKQIVLSLLFRICPVFERQSSHNNHVDYGLFLFSTLLSGFSI